MPLLVFQRLTTKFPPKIIIINSLQLTECNSSTKIKFHCNSLLFFKILKTRTLQPPINFQQQRPHRTYFTRQFPKQTLHTWLQYKQSTRRPQIIVHWVSRLCNAFNAFTHIRTCERLKLCHEMHICLNALHLYLSIIEKLFQ